MTEIEAILTGAIIGGFIGVFGTYIGAIFIYKRQEYRNASDELHKAFSKELALLRVPPKKQGIENDFNVILEKSFRKHQAAVSHFSRFLSSRKRTDFINAWNNYYSHGDTDVTFFDQYASSSRGLHNQKDPRIVAIERIEKILNYT